MVTKGEIQSIDYEGNTCVVRLPYFESAGIKDNIQAEATINNQPGMYNGYKAGDIVWVAFEDGEASQPVVIGKLYLGVDKEKNDPRGVVNAESSIISSNIQLPITTKIIYETDGTVAQNGITRYNTLSDITNELGKLSGKQSLTTVDMAGLTTTANQIKAEVSSIKSQTGVKTNYIQADEPKSSDYIEWAPYEQFTSADQYIGFYINIGTKAEPKYIEITDENKEVWITNPGTQIAYKEQLLAVNNTWLYTGDDLYEKETQPTKLTDFIGCYAYCKDDGNLADKDPLETTCPVSKGHHNEESKCYKADKGYKFVLISSDNKSKITDIENTAAYKIHLAKNTAFRVANIENNIVTWEETTLSYIKGFASSITQTDKSIDAKVNKIYNDKTVDFGWKIEQQDDVEIDTTAKDYHVGDEYGKFTLYSDIEYSDTSKESPGKTDVFHANRNGVTITGNLEVQDSDNQKIFKALPYGEVSSTDKESGKVTYDGNPQVQIGGFTIQKDTLTSEVGVDIGPEGLSITNSDQNQFSVLSDGTVTGKKLFIENTISAGTNSKHAADGSAESYFDGNICGHQIKVDTVELATTSTDAKEVQTSGFRVEKYAVYAENNDDTWDLTFAVDNVYNERKLTSDNKSYERVASTDCPYCVLSNKTIEAMLKITYLTTDNDVKTLSCSVSGTLVGYPYNADGTLSDDQKQFCINSSDIENKKKQSEILVKIKVTDGILQKGINETSGWNYSNISGLSKITNIKKISSIKVLSITPNEEEYFTGDFLASTGYFKDRNGCFTEGAVCDVFSLPWQRITKKNAIAYERTDVSIKSTKLNTVETDTNKVAYKELRRGDFCVISLATKNYQEFTETDDSNNVTYTEYIPTDLHDEDTISDPTSDTSIQQLIPALSHFTFLNSCQLSTTKTYNTDTGWSNASIITPINYPLQSSVGIAAPIVADGVYPDTSDVNNAYIKNYNISVARVELRLGDEKKAGTTIIDDKQTQLYSRDVIGLSITLVVDQVPFSLSDSEIKEETVKVYATQDLTKYTANGSSYSERPATFSKDSNTVGIESDYINLLFYGANAKIKQQYYKNSSNKEIIVGITNEIGVQNSGAYLRQTNATSFTSPAITSMVGNISACTKSATIKAATTTQDWTKRSTDMVPNTPKINGDTTRYQGD